MERVEAVVSGTVYRNDENGYSVVTAVSGRKEFTAVGAMPELSEGEQVVLEGEWTEHPKYGRQLKCVLCSLVTPTTILGIERYLGGGRIRGIGPTTAKLIVRTFGEDTLTILSEHPERLTEVPGIGRVRAAMIAESFQEQQASRQSMIFLQSHGVPPGLAARISSHYGERTADIIRADPYRLCDDLTGVGFQTADRIAMTFGVPKESESRVASGLKHVLLEASVNMGHVYLPEELLIEQTSGLLDVKEELCAVCLDRLILKRELTRDGRGGESRIYLSEYEKAEREVALRLNQLLLAGTIPEGGETEREIDRFEKTNGIAFCAEQREAIGRALTEGVLVITGGPGTGKTTIIKCILSLLSPRKEVVLCAPTGRAAKRMKEATGREGKTIHRLLEFNGEEGCFLKDQDDPLDADCVIVDETSMVDLMLMRALLRAAEPGTRVILVGDADQLPSVGAGNVLGDILQSDVIPVVRLREIYRQSETSRIIVNAHRVDRGEMPLLNEKGTDFFFEKKQSFTAAADSIVAMVSERLPNYLGIRNEPREIMKRIQVLTPMKKGECGAYELNWRLQEILNPPSEKKPEIRGQGRTYRLGDKVMQMKNNYDLEWAADAKDGEESGKGVFNGDIGTVVAVDPEEECLVVRYDEERDVVYGLSDTDELELAYCMTVHKSQGSEFPVVVMPVIGGPPMLLTRNLFYTALTRARSLVVLIGREEVIRRMTENDHIMRRYTSLTERLREAVR